MARPATRVSFYGYPVRGHTVPSLPVVAELARRGAELDYYSTPAFRTMIEAAGARFREYPSGCAALLTAPVEAGEHLARCLAAADAMLPDLLAALEPAPDLVLFDASALWGGIIARRIKAPCAASITTFAFTRAMLQMFQAPQPSAWSAPARDRLNEHYGTAFCDHFDMMVPVADLKLVFTARGFQPAGRYFDATYLFVGPVLDRRPRHGERVEKNGTRPLAYVSLGTLFNRDLALLHRVAEVLVAQGWQVIVSLGDAAAVLSADWPAHVQVHAFVDQIGVLGQAQLFVTHGGMNSVSEALSHAVPMIVIPQAVDQHLVARQTANLGAAVVLDSDDVSAESLTAALARIESEYQSFHAAAARIQRDLANVVGVSDAIDRTLELLH